MPSTAHSLSAVAGALAGAGLYMAVYAHEKANFEAANAAFLGLDVHGRTLSEDAQDKICKDRYVYMSGVEQQGLPQTGGPNTMSWEEYAAIVGASVVGGIVMAVLSGLYGLLLGCCRLCKCKCCGNTTPTKGCCTTDPKEGYSKNALNGNKAGVAILFILLVVFVILAGVGNGMFTEGLTGMFTAVLGVTTGLETAIAGMDTKLQSINITSMSTMKDEMTNAREQIVNYEAIAIQIDQLRSAAIYMVCIFPLVAVLLAVCGCGIKKRGFSCCATFFTFLAMIFMWLSYALHAPFGRAGDDLCFTIDHFLCNNEINDFVCFLSAGVSAVQASLSLTLGETLGNINTAGIIYGYAALPNTDPSQSAADVVAMLTPYTATIDADLVRLAAIGLTTTFSNLQQCQDTLSGLSSNGAVAEAICNRIVLLDTPMQKVYDDLFMVNGFVRITNVIYDVSQDLDPWSKCDYVADLMVSVKTLLCNMLIRGVVLIQNACLLSGIFLIPFALLTVQGHKRWGKDVVAVAPA
jgi:hypothetical protein